jgi:outer membrane lipoprotein-sorting protein
MKNSLLIAMLLLTFSVLSAAESADQLYANLERRLQSLKSLEIRYEAVQSGSSEITEGHLIWVRPDLFYHDTPEWTLCETKGEQWRLLKQQQTLIREKSPSDGEWLGEQVLFNLQRRFQAASFEILPDARRALHLKSTDAAQPGNAELEFPADKNVPDVLRFEEADGSQIQYRMTEWRENVAADASLFEPPVVPPANVIDFRQAGEGR